MVGSCARKSIGMGGLRARNLRKPFARTGTKAASKTQMGPMSAVENVPTKPSRGEEGCYFVRLTVGGQAFR